uniref:Uncharacterized protein n=1 Tax=Panagrolaimus sp. JU765 TaxID=591449 RepID=A0AC34RT57_9BILA
MVKNWEFFGFALFLLLVESSGIKAMFVPFFALKKHNSMKHNLRPVIKTGIDANGEESFLSSLPRQLNRRPIPSYSAGIFDDIDDDYNDEGE